MSQEVVKTQFCGYRMGNTNRSFATPLQMSSSQRKLSYLLGTINISGKIVRIVYGTEVRNLM